MPKERPPLAIDFLEHLPRAKRSRVILTLTGIGNILLGLSAWTLRDVTLSELSSLLFIVGGISSLVAAKWFGKMLPVAIAGACSTTAYASRAGLLVYSATLGHVELSDQRIILGIVGWLMLAMMARVVFIYGIGPVARLYQED